VLSVIDRGSRLAADNDSSAFLLIPGDGSLEIIYSPGLQLYSGSAKETVGHANRRATNRDSLSIDDIIWTSLRYEPVHLLV
jgi:hypothetical protein